PRDSEGVLQLAFVLDKLKKEKEAVKEIKRGISENPEDPFLKYDLGILFFKKREYKKALEQWSDLTSEQTKDIYFMLNVAQCYISLNDYDRAASILEKEINENMSGQALALMGRVMFLKKDKAKALDYSERAMALDPANQTARFTMDLLRKDVVDLDKRIKELERSTDMEQLMKNLNLSLLYFRKGSLKKAVKILIPMAEKKNPQALSAIALFYREASDYENEIKYLNMLIPLHDKPHEIFQRIGQSYFLQKSFLKAHEYFNMAKAKNPTISIRYDLAYTLLKMNLYDKAIAEVDFILKEYPNHTPSKALKAYILKITKRDKGALELWQQVAKEDGSNAQIYINLGLDAYEKNEFESALQYYNKALEIAPNMKIIHLNLGNIYRKQGLLEEAKGEYKKVADKNKKVPGAFQNIALLYMQQDSAERAMEYINQGLIENPGNSDLLLTKGHLFLKTNDPQNAVDCFKKVKGYDRSAKALRGLGEAYLALNTPDAARKFLFESFKLDS
ncbi:MAG: tetratricopeptide repeat protein, partial [Elusimicrobiota bacterium]